MPSAQRTPDDPLTLRLFDKRYAPLVATWAPTDHELLWLAPRTPPPLTGAKVADWCKPADRPLLLFQGPDIVPCGYGELNPLAGDDQALWMGHVVLRPDCRGLGLGGRFVRALIDEAFALPSCRRIVLVVFPDNHAALRCYSAAGFTVTAEEYYRFPGHRGQFHLLRMTLQRPVG